MGGESNSKIAFSCNVKEYTLVYHEIAAKYVNS